MALSATIYTFEIELADSDRAVYETLNLRVAQHPSETTDYLLTRVIAYCLEYTEGIAFSKGLSDPGDPAIAVRDLTGALQAWIDIGLPEPERLHRASKAAPRVAVYTHKDPERWSVKLAAAKVYRAEKLEALRVYLQSWARSHGEEYRYLFGPAAFERLATDMAQEFIIYRKRSV